MILIISYPEDPAANAGERMLRARGADVVRFEALQFPARGTSMSLRFGPRGGVDRKIAIDGVDVDLHGVTAVWHRRHRVVAAAEIRDPRMRTFVEIEAEQVLSQTWADLPARFLPAPLSVIRAGQHKLRQLALATKLGLEIPPTLVTSDPDELVAFHREHHGRVITKLVDGTAMDDSRLSGEYARFTEPLRSVDLAARDSLRLCPVYAQANVPKACEIRATVVGERVFAAALDSQAVAHGRDDWRKAGPTAVPYRVHALPADVARRCVAITRALGLCYGAIDLVLRPDGAYVFLEINPAGEYHWIEALTGLPITAAIVDVLTEPLALRTVT